LLQGAHPITANGVGHRPEHSQGRDADDQSHGLEENGRNGVDERRDLLRLRADKSQADAEDHCEEQHLEHVVTRQRVE